MQIDDFLLAKEEERALMRNILPCRWVDAATWTATYALLWLLLTGGEGWLFAAPALLIASVLALQLHLRPWYFRLQYVLPFIIFFLRAMLAGAWDVARRALHPRRPVQPGWLHYTVRSANPRVQLIFTAVVGLLPGTLAAKAESRTGAQHLHIHVLDTQQPHRATLTALETQLDRLLL